MGAKQTAAGAVSVDIGLFLMRAILAIVFMFHGSQKLFAWFGGGGLSGTADFMEQIGLPLPMASAVMAGITEFFGGVALLLGAWTRLAAVPMAFTMFVAAFVAHGGAFSAQAGGMEFPLTLGVVLSGLVFTGGGRVAVTTVLRKRRNRAGDVARSAET